MKNYNQPILSIIVPVYNVKEFLAECIDSIIAQSHKNWELILVDDGSSDGSGDVCESYSSKDERIKTIHKPNGGLSSARNAGLDVVIGKYVTFVDSDDVIIGTDTFARIVMVLEENSDIDVVQYDVIFKYSSPYEHRRQYPFQDYDSKEAILDGYLSQHIHVSCCDKIFKTSIFKDVRFPLNQISEDIATIPAIVNNIHKLRTANIGSYGYRYREGSISTSVLPYKKICSILQSYKTYLEYSMSFNGNVRRKALTTYANLMWDYLSLIRKNYFNELSGFYNQLFFIKIKLKEWFEIRTYLSYKTSFRLLLLCVIGVRWASVAQKFLTR